MFANDRDLLILDSKNTVWRWRPADTHGRGTFTRVRIKNATAWGTDVRAIGTFIRDPQAGLYNLYVVDPSEQQVLTYTPAIDGSGYPAPPTRRLPTNQKVDDVTSMYIDFNIFLTQGGAIRRVVPTADWKPDPPGSHNGGPGDDVIRPAPTYTLVTGTGEPTSGTLFVYDRTSARIVALDEPSGTFKEQYRLANGDQRKSLQERYKDHAGYVKAVTKAARALAKDGMLLADDVQRYIDAAEASNLLR